jgi:hypothetical protein
MKRKPLKNAAGNYEIGDETHQNIKWEKSTYNVKIVFEVTKLNEI